MLEDEGPGLAPSLADGPVELAPQLGGSRAGREVEGAARVTVAGLDEADWRKRRHAARKLGRLGSPAAAQALVQGLSDPATQVGEACLAALLQARPAQLAPLLEAEVARGLPRSRLLAARGLAELGTEASLPAFAGLIDYLARAGQTAEQRQVEAACASLRARLSSESQESR
jgi:hypothetical protein